MYYSGNQRIFLKMIHFLVDMKHHDHKIVLLYRFHLVVIVINFIAFIIDMSTKRYSNVAIELAVSILLLLSLWYLRSKQKLKQSVYIFIAIVSIGLFTLIYLNHFATMSIVFILLLPLMTLLFLELKESLFISALLFAIMAILFYIESLNNPLNPLIQNPQAIFNLTYAALIVYVFGLLYHFSILRTFKELDSANRQKALLLKEVHHRVKNNLNVIASIIGLQENRLEGKEKEELLKSKSRIESIALVHEMLYRDENFESINFIAYMQSLSNLLLGMYASDKKIHVDIQNDTQNIPLDVMVQLGIMVNELLTNSIKYAFETKEGDISIALHREEEGYLFVYSDNGKGHPSPELLKQSKSLGIKLIYLTARQLKGELQISSPQGLHYALRFNT
jgi:two-component sensor histidine kinase